MFNRLIKGFKNPKLILIYLLGFKVFRMIPDKLYLKIKYNLIMSRKLDLKNSKSFNEKLQWLKIYDRNPIYTDLVDKYKVRKYILKELGEEYLIPLLDVYNKFREYFINN